MRIALCFSGHVRNYLDCADKIRQNLISVLRNAGHEVDIFLVTWNQRGHRCDGFGGDDLDFGQVISTLNPVQVSVENSRRDVFITNFPSNQWRSRPHLSNPCTSGDGASMWYQVEKVWEMMETYAERNELKYDFVFRVRPDIVYTQPFRTQWLEELPVESIGMAVWHGKYEAGTCRMMDHFGFGRYDDMKKYMTIYSEIPGYLQRNDVTHTGEGFLAERLKDIPITRFPICYQVQRKNGREDVAG